MHVDGSRRDCGAVGRQGKVKWSEFFELLREKIAKAGA
jgi:hypothetical protein